MLVDLAAAVKAVFALLAALAAAAAGAVHPAAPAHTTTSTRSTAPTRTAPAAPATVPVGAPTTRGPIVHGKATHYAPAALAHGNCSYPSVPQNGYTVAAGPALYGQGAACGGYLDVTSGGRTIRVKITDQCPECGPGHLDLTDEAFRALAPLVVGVIPITYRVVTNPHPATALSLRVKEGSSQYWLALLVDGAGNRLRSVELRAGSQWRALQRSDYGYWIAPSGAGNGPFTVRITDVAGHRATAARIRLTPGVVQRTAVRLYR